MDARPAALLLACALARPSAALAMEGAGAARAAIGALDILFIFVAIYAVWRILGALMRRGRQEREDEDKTYDVTPENPDEDGSGRDERSRRAQAAWQYLTGEKMDERRAPEAGEHQPDAPGTFNEKEFLSGAKIIYGRIRKSWAARDLADLRQFAAPDMMRQFEQWAEERPEHEEMTVLIVEAKVLDLKRDGVRTEVRVGYDATLNDDPKVKELKKVHEVWTFSRDETVQDANWLLESMEKVQ